MEPQHFILCSSCVAADMQSANCRPKKATTANTTNSLLPIMLVRLYVDWMPESTKGYTVVSDLLRDRQEELLVVNEALPS